MGKGEHRLSAFPAHLDGDLPLWESGAICQYIAAKADRTDLWPTRRPGRCQPVESWNHTHVAPPIAV